MNKQFVSVIRQLVEKNASHFLPFLPKPLLKLGDLYNYLPDIAKAQTCLEEALSIYRQLADEKPLIFFPKVAATLNHLGTFYFQNANFASALPYFEESLYLYRKLTQINPDEFRHLLIPNLLNLGIFYLNCEPNRNLSITYTQEALGILQDVQESLEMSPMYLQTVTYIFQAWNFGFGGETQEG